MPKIFQIMGRHKSQRQTKKGWEIKLRPPTAEDLAQYAGIMVDSLQRLGLVQHVLILLDDVDLLEGSSGYSQNGQLQRSHLTDAVYQLHLQPGLDMVLTARSWYAHAHKELETLIDLADSETMGIEDLMAIHDAHFETFSPKGYPRVFLSQQALQEAAADASGLPGVFLAHLKTAFAAYKDESDWGERDYPWFLDVFKKLCRHIKTKCPDAARVIESAVKKGEFNFRVSDEDLPYFNTRFLEAFVFQSYYGVRTFYIDALMHKLVDQNPALVIGDMEGEALP